MPFLHLAAGRLPSRPRLATGRIPPPSIMSPPFTSDDNWLLRHGSLDASPDLRDPHGLFGTPTHATTSSRRRAIATSVEDLFRAPLPAPEEAAHAAAVRAQEAEDAERLATQRRVQGEMALLMQQGGGRVGSAHVAGAGVGIGGATAAERGEGGAPAGTWGVCNDERRGRRDSRDSRDS